jgi:aspartate/methionine/tyrosine aminotransferase
MLSCTKTSSRLFVKRMVGRHYYAATKMSPPALLSACDVAWVQPTSTKRATTRLFSSQQRYSQRGIDAVKLLPTYLADARAVEKYNAKSCPQGALQLSVAENQMLEDMLVPALTDFGSQQDFAADLIYYQPTQGRPGLRSAFGAYLERLLQLSSPLNPDCLVVGAGCNAVLENLCLCLANAGDAVLIPTPYYAAFEFDLQARANLRIVPVNTMQKDYSMEKEVPVDAYYPTRNVLQDAYEEAVVAGTPPKVLLLSHPNNPLGICYPPEVVQECIDWCREKQVHLISDEIYAGSVYDAKRACFTSAIELARQDQQELGDHVHLVYALSKDFGLSGLRVGAVYTENEHIQVPLQKLNDLCQISSQTQVTVERMLSSLQKDEQYWTDAFLKENCKRIQARCDVLQSCLDECGIPYLKADSGLFLWMDFSQFLPPLDPTKVVNDKEELESMEERERILYLELMKEYGLLFTPGMSMRNVHAGLFRCVFTAASDHEFALGLERIRAFASAKR